MTLYNTSPRAISLQLLALNANGSTLMDLSPYLMSAQCNHSDQGESHKATFILSQAGGIFDPLSNGTYSSVLKGNLPVQYNIIINGTSYARYYGTIQQMQFSYARGVGEYVQIDCLDPAYKLLKAEVTSGQFSNQQINLIASDLLLQYGNYTNTNFYSLNLLLPTFQCPSLTVIDALLDLYGIPNYFFWFNYSGQFTTSPRVGNGIVGIPDAMSAPTPNIILPDNAFISSSKPGLKVYDTINQVKVIGEELNASIQYGPIQYINGVGNANNNNFLAPGEAKNYPGISLTTGSSTSNQQTVAGLYVKVYDPSFNNFGGSGYKFLCSDPTAIELETGLPVPLGPFEDLNDPSPGHPSIVSVKSDETEEGIIYLNIVANFAESTGLSSWTTVPMFALANADGGGYEYYIEIYGKLIVTADNSITVFLDYDPTTLTGATCIDIFGDHKTYQVLDPANTSTTLYASASSGATTITVTSATGFAASDQIIIGTGSDYETQNIASIVGNVLTLTSALINNHSSGEIVQTNTTIQPIGMSAPVEIFVSPTEPPNSTLSANATTGATTITLASVTNFTPPQTDPLSISSMNKLRIGALSGTYEYADVVSVNSGTKVVTLANPLVNSYTSGTVAQGITAVITADGLFVSDLVRVDFEQGRIVFDDLTYNNFLEDSMNLGTAGEDTTYTDSTPFGLTVIGGNAVNASGQHTSTGGLYQPPTITGLTETAPLVVYETYRQSNTATDNIGFKYVMTGFTPGRGYTLRLHFYEWYYVTSGQRVFNVLCNEVTILSDFDIYATAGLSFQLVIQEFTGINSDTTGTITLQFVNGSGSSSNSVGYPIVQCVEVLDPQGVGGALPEIDCGGAAITPTPPIVTMNGCYSENQRLYGLQSQEIDNPLLSTEALCIQSGQYALDRAAWSCYPIELVCASFPTITPAIIIQYFNPYAGSSGADQWVYVQNIAHHSERTASECTSTDTIQGFLLYSQAR